MIYQVNIFVHHVILSVSSKLARPNKNSAKFKRYKLCRYREWGRRKRFRKHPQSTHGPQATAQQGARGQTAWELKRPPWHLQRSKRDLGGSWCPYGSISRHCHHPSVETGEAREKPVYNRTMLIPFTNRTQLN